MEFANSEMSECKCPGADVGVAFNVRQHVFVKYVGKLCLATAAR